MSSRNLLTEMIEHNQFCLMSTSQEPAEIVEYYS